MKRVGRLAMLVVLLASLFILVGPTPSLAESETPHTDAPGMLALQAMGWLWGCAGIGLGVLIVWIPKRFAGRPAPEAGYPIYLELLRDFFIRHILMGLILLFCISHDITAGALLVLGLWLGRWATLLLGPELVSPAQARRQRYAPAYARQRREAADSRRRIGKGRQYVATLLVDQLETKQESPAPDQTSRYAFQSAGISPEATI